MRATVTGEPYTVFGYGAKQVRDNIHSADLVAAFEHFHLDARAGGAVYNIGGGRMCNCSMLEAIELCQSISGRELRWTLSDQNRIGDHRWWISDVRPFATDYPGWRLSRGLQDILRELHDENAERWLAEG
jgi:CDP-paratose 2-epimerase